MGELVRLPNADIPLDSQVTEVSFNLPANADYEQWKSMGEWIGQMREAESRKSALFWVGDWLIFGENNLPDQYSQAIEITGYDIGTLANAKYVANAIPPSRRMFGLGWSFHQAVAPMKPQDQDLWLLRAKNEGMKLSEFRKLLAGTKAIQNNPEAPSKDDVITELGDAIISVIDKVKEFEQAILVCGRDIKNDKVHSQNCLVLARASKILLSEVTRIADRSMKLAMY